jgi:2-keto-4-pentenoate hydratase
MKRTLFLVLAVSGVMAGAAPPSAENIRQFAEDYFAVRPSQAFPPGMKQEEALQTQKDLIAKLVPRLGDPVGYKVGLVTKEAQQRFGLNSPVRGILLSKMLLKDAAEVPMSFGVHPVCEADLVVVVKDEGINEAKTPLDVARHLKEVVAFIELPDALIATNQLMDAGLFTASNVGARLGVLGERLPVKASDEFVNAMGEMTVTVRDQMGVELGKAQGKLILGNPLNAVLWLVQDLARSGEKLKAGDILSLGSLKALTPQAGQTITVRYEGLPGGPIKATVRFR